MKRIRCLIFDLDGTLVDSFHAISTCFNRAMGELGYPLVSEHQIHQMVGIPLEDMFLAFLHPEKVGEGVRRYRVHYRELCVPRTTLLRGVGPALKALHEAGYTLAVATNKPEGFTQSILDGLSIGEYFAMVVGPESVSAPKPDPEMILLIMNNLGLKPCDIIYVGDSETDIVTAQRAGVGMFAVATGVHAKKDLAAFSPNWVGDDLSQLVEILNDGSDINATSDHGCGYGC